MPARRSRGAALRRSIAAFTAAALIITACSGGKRTAPATAPPGTAPAAVQSPGAATTQPDGTGSPAETPPPAARMETPAPPRPPTPSPTPVLLDPCSLVTEGEAAAVLGRPAGPPHVQRTPLLAQCQYAPASATPAGATPTPAATLPTVTIQVFPTGPLTWPVRKETFMKVNKTVIAVTGVGEDAFWVGDQEALFVLQHGVIFAIRVLGREPESDLADARVLALKAATRVG